MKNNRNQVLRLILFALLLNTIFITRGIAGLEPGTKAPNFKLPSLTDGKEVELKDYLGKIVILHLWKCL